MQGPVVSFVVLLALISVGAWAAPPGVVETQLSNITQAQGDAGALVVAANGSSVCFSADAQTDTAVELFCAPTSPAQLATRVSGLLPAATGVTNLVLSADGSTVYYLAPEIDGGKVELFRAPTDGSSSPQRLNAPVTASGGNVLEFRLLESLGKIVYRADSVVDQRNELFVVDLATPESSTKLNGAIAGGAGGVVEFVVDPNAERVYYRAWQQFSDRLEVYANALDGSSPVKLSASLLAGRSAYGLSLVPGGTRILYTAETGTFAQTELWSVPSMGGSAVRLNQDLIAEGNVSIAAIAPDGSRVAYLADATVDLRFGLFSRAIDGSDLGSTTIQAAIAEYPPMSINSLPRITITPDSQNALFIDAYTNASQGHLRRAALDGSSSPVTLTGTHHVTSYLLVGDGTRAVAIYGFQPENLLAVAVDGSSIQEMTSFSGPVDVVTFPLHDEARFWAVLADADVDDRNVLFQLDLDSAVLTRMSSAAASFRGAIPRLIAVNPFGPASWMSFVDSHFNGVVGSSSMVLRGFTAGDVSARQFAQVNSNLLIGIREFGTLALDPTDPFRVFFTADRLADDQVDAFEAELTTAVYKDGFE